MRSSGRPCHFSIRLLPEEFSIASQGKLHDASLAFLSCYTDASYYASMMKRGSSQPRFILQTTRRLLNLTHADSQSQ